MLYDKKIISKETTIEEILDAYPGTVKVFMDFGVPCLVCGEPLWGTIGEVAEKYKVDITHLITRLNEIVET
jgi:hybrid cluster-associated redox disulfide protein